MASGFVRIRVRGQGRLGGRPRPPRVGLEQPLAVAPRVTIGPGGGAEDGRHAGLARERHRRVCGASQPGRGACRGVQPGVGAAADAAPVANRPPMAPVPTARTPSTAMTAPRRSFDGVTRACSIAVGHDTSASRSGANLRTVARRRQRPRDENCDGCPAAQRVRASTAFVREPESGRGEDGAERQSLGGRHRLDRPAAVDDRDEQHHLAARLLHRVRRLEERRAACHRVLGDHDLVARVERAGDAPASAVVLLLLAHAEGLEGAAPRRRHAGGHEGDGVGTHGEPADGRRLGRDRREHGVGHQQHGLGPAHRLLGVDEPAALAPRLEREVPRPDRVRQQVGTQVGERALSAHPEAHAGTALDLADHARGLPGPLRAQPARRPRRPGRPPAPCRCRG